MITKAPEKVHRHCPECGNKVTAPENVFTDPQVCPACKMRVYFLDYPKEASSATRNTEAEIKQREPTIDRALAVVIGVAVVAIVLFCLVALVTKQLTLFFVIGCLAFVAGIIAISIYLDSASKSSALKLGFREIQERLRARDERETRLVHALQGMRNNFDILVAEEKQAIQLSISDALRDAQLLRESAAKYLESAKEQSDAADAISKKLLAEVRKSIKANLTPNNFATMKQRFDDMVAFCAKKGFAVDQRVIDSFNRDLKSDYEEAVRKQLAREEQSRIKERIREEQKAERELEQELRRIEAEEKAIKKALEDAIARTNDEHSAEVQELRRRLAEAEAKAERTKSMAQLTKAGNVYVISNIGSFGENVFKIGMTRRLEPMDRVKELGDASVPFQFDVHLMISSENAPALEAKLHREFHHRRVNKVNLRKEFFRVSIDEIVAAARAAHGEVEYTVAPEALEYNESLTMSEEDFEFISSQIDPETLSED